MTIRARLLAFSCAQLLVFGALTVVGYELFEQVALPMLEEHLHSKAVSTARSLESELDIAIGADDRKLVAKIIADTVSEDDLAFVEVRDATGATIYRTGAIASRAPFAGAPHVAHDDGSAIRMWTPIVLEAVPLGAVSVGVDPTRVQELRAWLRRLLWSVGVVWLVAAGLSYWFALTFVRPIRAMIGFSRTVAEGQLSTRLDVLASGELRQLADDLNAMTTQLDDRERERLRAAERTTAMQRELLALSRMAGMAEIATGVLHNVGNVLNSLNVSVAVVDGELRNSKVAALGKSVQLFERHPGGLAAFVTTAKGQLLPPYLVAVAAQLAEENARMRGELESVTRNVDHIKSIVATQQLYAQPAGVREPVDVAALIDDALDMAESSLARHRIEIVRAYAERPTIVTDRHRLLQILVNLISNANAALKAHDAPVRRLAIELAPAAGKVAITVRDTGVGIAAENLEKIFQHGFTTKRDGHGFGLHSAANTARELGGSLTAASEGRGCGARFVIELPREAPGSGHVHGK